jgi:glycosyltransferase involved in cell wall biosynthesis
MKVLISAIACNPYLGSENYFGWAAVRALAQDYDLWVLTGSRNRPDLARAAAEGLVPPNVRFAYVGSHRPWHPRPMLARLQNWKEYIDFARASLAVAEPLHRAEKFDLVHHVTFTTGRVALPLWRLGIPFVFGPVCGNEEFPFRLFSLLSPGGAAFELTRKVSNVAARFSPGSREMIRRAAHVFAITREAEQLMATIRESTTGISSLSPGFYAADKVALFAHDVPRKSPGGSLRLYAAGNLGGQKCIALAFHALALAKQRGVDFRYHLGSSGPEIAHLKRLAAKLGLEKQIVFGGPMSRPEYARELADTHVYLLPSMRETVGLTMLEAMLAGCVPIVADSGGPRVAVTEECGYRIPVTYISRMAAEIAETVATIDRNRQIIAEKGAKASQRIAALYTEEHYRQTVGAVYQSLV